MLQKTPLAVILNGLFRYRFLWYAVLLIPAFVFRDYSPDNELKYLSIAQEALQNGTWFTFYNHGQAYADKPPLFFWLIMLSKLAAGRYYLWLIGLFSLLPALGILAVMNRWFLRYGVRHRPVVSEILLLTTVLFTASALVVRMDMLMTFFIVLSLYTFFRLYRPVGSIPSRWWLPIWIFGAVFTKGPMGFLIPVLSMLAFSGLQKDFRSLWRIMGWKS
ncbi:MAG: hypothetical protein LUD68_00925 [Rikenellaceae bacterium]|nr:hypothetical protein [Rikenellaceae bacterium]